MMRTLGRLGKSLVIWLVLFLGLAVLLAVRSHAPGVIARLAAMAEHPRPGDLVKPTPEMFRRAQESGRRRRAEDRPVWLRRPIELTKEELEAAVKKRERPE